MRPACADPSLPGSHLSPCRFLQISPLEEPINSGADDKIFITRSLDSQSHFESLVDDVRDVWRRATDGKPLDLKKRAEDEGAQVQA